LIGIASTIEFKGRGMGAALGARVAPRMTKAGRPVRGQAALSGQKAAKLAVRHVNAAFDYVTSGQFVDEAGTRAQERVKLRTVQGKDYTGKSLARYTPKYREWKTKQGRFRGKTDLWLKGDMLNAIEFRRSMVDSLRGILVVKPRKLGTITLQRLAQIHHKGEKPQPPRPFFSWKRGSMEDRKLIQTMRALMMRYVRQQGRRAHGVATGTSGRSVVRTLI